MWITIYIFLTLLVHVYYEMPQHGQANLKVSCTKYSLQCWKAFVLLHLAKMDDLQQYLFHPSSLINAYSF